jgi:hypothetical protein
VQGNKARAGKLKSADLREAGQAFEACWLKVIAKTHKKVSYRSEEYMDFTLCEIRLSGIPLIL